MEDYCIFIFFSAWDLSPLQKSTQMLVISFTPCKTLFFLLSQLYNLLASVYLGRLDRIENLSKKSTLLRESCFQNNWKFQQPGASLNLWLILVLFYHTQPYTQFNKSDKSKGYVKNQKCVPLPLPFPISQRQPLFNISTIYLGIYLMCLK